MMIDLSSNKKKIFSQFNQDGVLEEIFNAIGVTNRYFVEFGSHGKKDSQGNTAFLRGEFKFDGLLMDGSECGDTDYKVHKEFIRAETINDTFKKHNVPSEFDFLSIDIDGEDFHVMNAINLDNFKPRVVSVEINPCIPPPFHLVQKHDSDWVWDGGDYYGCSVAAIAELMESKNYSLVCICGVDAIFIDNDEIKKSGAEFKNINDIQAIYKLGVADLEIFDIKTRSLLMSPFFVKKNTSEIREWITKRFPHWSHDEEAQIRAKGLIPIKWKTKK
jgi:hypothetical protein|tara:strand:- start:1207 stop:2028 length:822 start_codon:yes stop_codon:yes gene_type:complete